MIANILLLLLILVAMRPKIKADKTEKAEIVPILDAKYTSLLNKGKEGNVV